MWRALAGLLLCASGISHAATTAVPLTPLNTSVLGGDRQVYSARFFDALGRPSAGETVFFSNDACGWFENGGFSHSVTTDANGTASVTFTARAQGITCWIVAQAGASVRFNVFTYTMGQVGLTGAISPAKPRPGAPFTVAGRAFAGSYPIYDADITARVVPEGAATVAMASNGSDTSREFVVTPVSVGSAFEVELGFRGLTRRVAIAASAAPWQDMWWSGSVENGWGMSVVQHRDQLFAAIYAYDAAGAPTWYVITGGTWNAARTAFTGALYSPRGTPYTTYDASRFRVGAPVGSATITFHAADEATLEYSIGGVTGTKSIRRQAFGPPDNAAPPLEVGDMWWGGPSQDGWGIALLQQYSTLFGVWFTYDANGAPTWFVMPSGSWGVGTTWEGRLYRTTGSPWVGRPYDANQFRISDAGFMSIRFEAGGATATYTIDGKPGTMAIMRQPF